jgi:ankyrin repeat protein
VNYQEPSKGGSPLQYAAQKGHVAIVKLRVDSKADVIPPICDFAQFNFNSRKRIF